MAEEREQTMEASPPSPLTISHDTHLKLCANLTHDSMCASKLQDENTQLKQSLREAKETVSSQVKELAKMARELKKAKNALKNAKQNADTKDLKRAKWIDPMQGQTLY